MSTTTLALDEREANTLRWMAHLRIDEMNDGMGTIARMTKADDLEEAATRLAFYARVIRAADRGDATSVETEPGFVDELRAYEQYLRECLEADRRSLERLRTTRDPGWSASPDVDEGIRIDEAQVAKSEAELAVCRGLLGRFEEVPA